MGFNLKLYLSIWFYMIILYIFIIPLVFIAYSIVVKYLSYLFNLKLIKNDYLNLVFKFTLVGVIFDYIIVLFLFLISFLINKKFNFYINYKKTEFGRWWYEVSHNIMVNPFENIYSLLIICLVIFIFKYINYRINLKYCMNNIEIDEAKKKKLALYTIILTAPYYFLIPTIWFAQ